MTIYNSKYKLRFRDVLSKIHRLKLRKAGYSGTEYDIKGGDDPVEYQDPNAQENKFNPIKGSGLTMKLIPDPDAAYDFKADFRNITDRDWIAELQEEVSSAIWQAAYEITNYDITATSDDPTGTVEITNAGSLATEPTCDIEFTIVIFPLSGDTVLKLVAVPEGETPDYADRIELASVTVDSADDNSDVENKILTNNSDFSSISPQVSHEIALQYKQTSYNSKIDTNWQIKVEYSKKLNWKYFNFTGATEKAWMEIQLIVADKTNADNPRVVTLARKEYENSETISTIVDELTNEANGAVVENVYFPNTDETYSALEFEATQSSATITITPLDVAGDWNGVAIAKGGGILNETYLRVAKHDSSTYDYNTSDFSGGSTSGDSFAFQVDTGSGFTDLARTTGYPSDDATTIIERLKKLLKYENAHDSYVDNANSHKAYYEKTEDVSGWQYRFITDGGSTLSPSTGTAFTSISGVKTEWIGWVTPGMYEQLLLPGYVEVTLKAIDGLGGLKNIRFEYNGEKPFQKLNFITILSSIFEQTDLGLNIYSAFPLRADYMDENQSALEQMFQDSSRLNGVSCYDTLKELMTILGAQVIQQNGNWVLKPLQKLGENSITYSIFNRFGNYIGNETVSGQLVDVGGHSASVKFINAKTILSYKSAFRAVQTNQNFGFVDQLIKMPTFNSIDGNVANILYPWHWKYADTIQSSFTSKVRKSGESLIIHQKEASQSGVFYLSQDFQIMKLPNPDESKKQYEFKVSCVLNDPVEFSNELTVMLKITNGTDTAYLADSEDYMPFVDAENTITITGSGSTQLSIKFNFPSDYSGGAGEYPFIGNNILDCEVRIYQDADENVKVNSVVMNAGITAESQERIESRYASTYNESTSEIYKKEVELGDVPDMVGAKQIYKNAIFYYDNDGELDITRNWYDPDDSVKRAYSLLKWMRELWLREYSRQIHAISGTIRGDITPHNFVRDITYGNRLYVFSGGKWSIKYREVNGKWVECGVDDSTLKSTGDGLVDEKLESKEASGSAAYKPVSSGDTDLSDYMTNEEITQLIENSLSGKQGNFTGADMTSRQITIYHNLGYEAPFLILVQDGKQMSISNYAVDTEGSTDHVILSIFIPFSDSTEFKYRFI